jgi:hypothetical protein
MRQPIIADLCQRFEADPDSIRFVKTRGAGNVHGYAVEFWGYPFPTAYNLLANTRPRKGPHIAFYLLVQRPSGTIFMPSASVLQQSKKAADFADGTSLQLGGSSTSYPFIGAILRRDTVVTSVRLTDANGEALEDDVVDGYALFVSPDALTNPLTFSLYDANGLLKHETCRCF